jgi:hypothetical protein
MRRILPFVIVVLGVSTASWAQQSVSPAPLPSAEPAGVSSVQTPVVAAPATTPPVRAGQARATAPPAPSVVTPVISVPAPAPVAQSAAAPPSSMAMSSWQNVRLEFTVSDTFGNTPSKKTVSMLVADRGTGRIRSSMMIMDTSENGGSYQATINVDATVTLPSVAAPQQMQNKVMVNLSVNYVPENAIQKAAGPLKPANLDESISVVLENGKPTLITQSADPKGDRKVTLEVTATVVK